MMKGNLSKLAKSEICQECARCCKVFEFAENIDNAIRFAWMKDDEIETRDSKFCWSNGVAIKEIIFHKDCKQLEKKDGKYFCKQYAEERPDFCCTYPDNIFIGTESWNKEKIKQIIEDAKKICPLMETMSVEEVIDKLYDKRNGYWIFP